MDINLTYLMPEIATALLAVLVLLVGLLVPKEKRHALGYVLALGLIAILVFSFQYYGLNKTVAFNTFALDDFAVFFKQLFLIAAVLVVLSSTMYVKKMNGNYEFYIITVVALLGMMVLASAADMLTLYIALETMAISFYILAGYKTDQKSAEAGIKYLILGAVSSAVFLYGLSLVYGMTGTTVIAEIAGKVQDLSALSPALILGLLFILAGLGFKISLIPFQMWTPDVYEGAPTPVTTFLATGSKAACFAVLARILLVALPDYSTHWQFLVAVLAALSMIIGNLVAIPQTNIKRMLAYSSIGQAGYIITGILALNTAGVTALSFYSLVYVLSTIAAFAVVMTFSAQTGSDEIKDYAGLAQRSPFMAAVLTISMLSMAGIPPLAGFVGKLYLFKSIVTQGYLWLVIIGLVMSMISVYYYLRVTKVMYMVKPLDKEPVTVPLGAKCTLFLTMLALLVFGVYAQPISMLANMAGSALLP